MAGVYAHPKRLILSVADYAEGNRQDAPALLRQAWRYRNWNGDPGDLPAGQLQQMTIALNVYDAVTGYERATKDNKRAQWKKDNPQAAKVLTNVRKLREDENGN